MHGGQYKTYVCGHINKIIIIHISQPYLRKQIPFDTFKIMAGSNFCHCLSKIQPTLSLLAKWKSSKKCMKLKIENK